MAGHVHNSDVGAAVNDPMTEHAVGAGEWGSPGNVGGLDHGGGDAELPPQPPLYTDGIFVGVSDNEATAVPGALHPKLLRVRSDVPQSYEAPHEATHRRYEPPFTVAIGQTAAGFTLVAPPKMGLHYVKVIACMLSLDAAGTLKFVQGSMDGVATGDVTGAMPLATNGGFVLPPAEIETPWFFTSPDQALGIFTVTGKASGFVTCCYSPYEA